VTRRSFADWVSEVATAARSAGYSGTPLAKKLGIAEAAVLALLHAPPSWSVPELPPEVAVRRGGIKTLDGIDVALAFCRVPDDVAALSALVDSLPARSALWVLWPRKAGGHVSDVDENLLRSVLLPTGVVDVKVAAVDTDWSGLKFLWRKENRPR
jgi:hypothetical protein